MTEALLQSAKKGFVSFAQKLMEPKVMGIILELCVIVALVAAVAGERTIIATQRRIMPAGDVFNFQSIARNIRYLDYPMQEKRLPGFPIAILIGTELGFDPTLTGIAISIIASAGTTVILYLLGRHFKWPIFPLAAALLLTSVAPLLTINGVRPLSDSYFLFLIVFSVYMVTVVLPTKAWALWTGFVLAFMVFTRYEGGPTAVLLLLLLRFKMPWRLVLYACLPLAVGTLLWIPVLHHINGSLSEFGYARDAKEVASLETLPQDYFRIVASSGFGNAWVIADAWSEDKQISEEAKKLPESLGWWLSALASFGFIWIIVSLRKEAVPLFVAFILYPVLPAWWFTYSRYVAPMSAFYFFCMAGGAVGVWQIIQFLFKRAPAFTRGIAAVLLSILLVLAIFDVAPLLYKEGVSRGLENNGRGYSLYSALQSLRHKSNRVAVSADYLMAYMMFGSVDSPKDGLNAGRGIYFSAKPEATSEELAAYMKDKKIDVLVDSGEQEVKDLVTYLKAHDGITKSEVFTWPRQDGDIDTTYIHHIKN